MFSVLSIKSQGNFFSPNDSYDSNSEDEHYEEVEDNSSELDDGIDLDTTIIDEYEDFEDEMESDIPEPDDSEIKDLLNFVDQEEAEHYDSLDDE